MIAKVYALPARQGQAGWDFLARFVHFPYIWEIFSISGKIFLQAELLE
jgi:hypothetical protein